MATERPQWDMLVIGGGAAGFFGALAASRARPGMKILILEKNPHVLGKVRISGGGRCNLTHALFDPAALVGYYPRGGKELRGPLEYFGPRRVMDWFAERGVRLKIEPDGRVFPASGQSQTIIDCLLDEANQRGIQVQTACPVTTLSPSSSGFNAHTHRGECITGRQVLLSAGGGVPAVYRLAASLGHTLVPPVPSLFTFTIPDVRLAGLAGVSVECAYLELILPGLPRRISAQGALLITHWGLSGPAALRISAWGARVLAELNYQAPLLINWLSNPSGDPWTLDQALERLQAQRHSFPRQHVLSHDPTGRLPLRLWQSLGRAAGLSEAQAWAETSNRQLRALAEELTHGRFLIQRKGPFKEEFVTCGGVSLKEVDFKTMQSRCQPGLYLAGEVLDIDGLTGGFNLQAAWTTGWIAGQALAEY